ncbi:hypothetical protein GCM10010381_57720 [Streptomyces xantholiticus]|nr:hypothetical protein GCM10010381_57720 [Streptomyces xantholiticus]
MDADRVSYPKCVRIIRCSIPSQLGATTAKLIRSFTEAERAAGSLLLPARRKPGLPTRDQETEPMAPAQDPRQTQHRAARPLGPQPVREAEDLCRAGRPVLKGTQAVSAP